MIADKLSKTTPSLVVSIKDALYRCAIFLRFKSDHRPVPRMDWHARSNRRAMSAKRSFRSRL
jgi:hypothetical protein